jgi:hypothetical protein
MNKRRRFKAKARRAAAPVYINAYLVDQQFGGREEGGWWYDVGELLESVRVRTTAGRARVRAALLCKYAGDAGSRSRFSTGGGPDVEIYTDDAPGADFPQRRPHYE